MPHLSKKKQVTFLGLKQVEFHKKIFLSWPVHQGLQKLPTKWSLCLYFSGFQSRSRHRSQTNSEFLFLSSILLLFRYWSHSKYKHESDQQNLNMSFRARGIKNNNEQASFLLLVIFCFSLAFSSWRLAFRFPSFALWLGMWIITSER